MLRYPMEVMHIDIFDPYNMLPIERTVTHLGERR